MILRENCPICGQEAVSLFSWPFQSDELAPFLRRLPTEVARPYLAQRYEARHCRQCDFTFQKIAPDNQEVLHLYALHVDASIIEKEIEVQKLHWFAHMAEEILVLRQMIAVGRPKVLDFGCNWGKWASMALAFGCDVDAVEVNPVTSAFCSSRGIRIVDPDSLADDSYDFINVDQVLEHISDPRGLAETLARKLAPGGLMKWSTPQDRRLSDALVRASEAKDGTILRPARIDALEPLIHINLFSNRALRELGRKVGMEAVSLPFFAWLGAGQMWNLPRQIGRNLSVPKKRWLRQGTYLWFRRTAPS
jgi:hypothetical protein